MGAMSDAALNMLLERLLWPPPRVRWEVARSLAKLIRAGDGSVTDALTAWIGERQLESEATLGLEIIHAFDLGRHFDAQKVEQALQAPSLLSDWLVQSTFPERIASPGSPLRFAPDEQAVLQAGQEAWFERYRTAAVPRIFSSELWRLQTASRRPFMERWRHEWRWLQAQHAGPAAEFPWSFSQGARERAGQFDLRQRDLYVTAYLRTLAYAVAEWGMPRPTAEGYSRVGLVLNRGLADLEPIPRPEWTEGLSDSEPADFLNTARTALDAAAAMHDPDERLVAMRVADISDRATFEMELRLVGGIGDFTAGEAEAAELNQLTAHGCPGELGGLLAPDAEGHQFDFDEPVDLTQDLLPGDVGRAHAEIAPTVRFGSPYVFGRSVEVRCTSNDIRLETPDGTLSRWLHWYAEWDVTHLAVAESCVSSISTVSANSLNRLVDDRGLTLAWLVTATFGRRRDGYGDFEAEHETGWLSAPRQSQP